MEFSYQVSEAEYRSAWKLRCRSHRSKIVKTAMFWVFLLVCLMLLWGFVQHGVQQAPIPQEQVAEPASSGHSTTELVTNVGPFVLLAGVWTFMIVRLGPGRLRRLYRKDPSMQGQFTVNIAPGTFAIQNSAGWTSHTGWNLFEFWREGKDVIVLVFHTGTYYILCLSGLSEAQRAELRGIISLALPKK